ncbi:MAG: sigma-70 family RNA polymerase sigma factor [Anaerolineales bacterium]|nr:sigma-70 family RNA polymerase sigma factor [Anaerolineales bacterium]
MAADSSVDYEAFYRQQMPKIYNFFRYRFGDNALAEDLTAATFEKAWQKRDQYRHDLSALSTWLFTIARRIAIDHYRQAQVEVAFDETDSLVDRDNLEEQASQADDLAHLNALLIGLESREQELIALKYGAGMTNRAIADQCGLSESNVAVILFRAVRSLREKWEQSYE